MPDGAKPRAEVRQVFAFDAVKIKMLGPTGRPLGAGVRQVWAHQFEVEVPGVNPLLVKCVRIEAASVEFRYNAIHDFTLPDSLEVGTNGILQKTVHAHFPVEITWFVEEAAETPESELPTQKIGGD